MTYTLTSDTGASAVVKSRGGELISYMNDGVEYVWQGDPAHWDGQAPILFPVCCSPKDGKMAFDGVEYPMTKHGFVMDKEFETVFLTKNAVTLELRESEETLAMFPFRFTLQVTYTVTDDGFEVAFAVVNRDRREMTFCIGGHPGFNCPLFEGEGFEDYRLVFDNADGAVVSVTKGGFMDDSVPKVNHLQGTDEIPLRYSDFDRDAMIIEHLPVHRVKLISRKTGRGIAFDFEGFDALGLWTPEKIGSPFLCLEPWNGLPADVKETTDAKSKKYAITLAPGETYRVGYRTQVI